jgi:hypothetical protein
MMKYVLLVLVVHGAVVPAESTTRPTTEPATQLAVARTWKWDNQMYSTEEKVATVKAGMKRGMKFDDLCVLLKAANFSPPNLKSSTAAGDRYESLCWIDHTRGPDGWKIAWTVDDNDKVTSFKFIHID